jgi:hypothetical protein
VLAVAAAAFVTHWLIKIANCQSRSFTILHFSTALRTIPIQQIMNLFAARMSIWRGTTCNFSPATPAITSGGTASTSLTITATVPTSAAAMPWFKGITGLLVLPASLLLLGRIRKGARGIQALLCLALLVLTFTGLFTGCSGGSKIVTQPNLPTGPQTILVSAATDSVTKTVPLTLNVQ